ncbi:hypothetical protein HY411_00850 [Candidatus Gottesmanbacteria bacterium]|nr:hypothetical protein [Candidatus Gottesmanbacteria bacterium]
MDMDQMTLLRRMSGRARLEQAFKLSDFVRELSLKNIRAGRKISRAQAIQQLRERIALGESYAR